MLTAASQGLPCKQFVQLNTQLAPKVSNMCGAGPNSPESESQRCRCFAVCHQGTDDRVDVFRVLLDQEEDAALSAALKASPLK